MHEFERLRDGTFDPDAMKTLAKAYAEALDILGPDAATDDKKAQLAKHLIELARSGESEGSRLSSMAVLQVLGRDPASPAA